VIPDETGPLFTSDTHFAHVNREGTGIIDYCQRPFDNIEHHDAELIRKWNEKVPPKADVYHLGDLVFHGGGVGQRAELLGKLNGRIHLIRGNHDKNIKSGAEGFVWVKDYYELKIQDPELDNGGHLKIVLFHFPLITWNANMWGSWHFHGHSHGQLPVDPRAARLDVGVDAHGFTPISYGEIKQLFTKRLLKSWKEPRRTDAERR